jgi:sugar phosphate isomerase/epimerase
MKLQWAMASASVMNVPWDDEFALWKKYKWKSVELWYDKIQACLDAGRTLADLLHQLEDAGVRPVGLAPGVVWAPGGGHDPRHERDELQKRMDTALALGAPRLAVMIVGKPSGDLAAVYRELAEKLRGVAAMAEARGLRVCLEFIGGLPVNGTMGTCIELVREVDHPALGMLLDLCHYYASASHIEELDTLPKQKLFLVHVADAQKRPMEVLGCEHRTFPGEGRIDIPCLLAEILRRTKYDGPLSVELYDRGVWSMDPKEVFKRTTAGIKAIEKAMGKKPSKKR